MFKHQAPAPAPNAAPNAAPPVVLSPEDRFARLTGPGSEYEARQKLSVAEREHRAESQAAHSAHVALTSARNAVRRSERRIADFEAWEAGDKRATLGTSYEGFDIRGERMALARAERDVAVAEPPAIAADERVAQALERVRDCELAFDTAREPHERSERAAVTRWERARDARRDELAKATELATSTKRHASAVETTAIVSDTFDVPAVLAARAAAVASEAARELSSKRVAHAERELSDARSALETARRTRNAALYEELEALRVAIYEETQAKQAPLQAALMLTRDLAGAR